MVLNMKTGKLSNIASLDHVNILTKNIDKCRKFYVEGLGFEEGFRPFFDIPGLWLYLGDKPVIHIIEIAKPLPNVLSSGSIDHIAFRAHNFDKFVQRLDKHKIKWEDREIVGMDLHQLFCHDPHGIKVEFNFEGQDRPWSTLERLRYEM
jgi:catechol 2,3-dioxygenase-like lactoylglutathione lyase family enzyme